MTELSKQARDLAGFAWQMGHLDYERDRNEDVEVIARRIDAALVEARRETRTGRHWRIIADQERAHAHSLQAERDKLAATVERVQALADAMERDHAKDDASSGGWFFATEAAIEGLRDALNGADQ